MLRCSFLEPLAFAFTDFVPGLLNALIYAIVMSALTLFVASLTSRRTIAAGAVVAVFLVTTPVSVVISVLGHNVRLHQASHLTSVTGILGGVRTWLFSGGQLEIGPFGPIYAGFAVVLVALCTFLLVYRYRKVSA